MPNNLAHEVLVHVIDQFSHVPNYHMIMFLVNYSRNKQLDQSYEGCKIIPSN